MIHCVLLKESSENMLFLAKLQGTSAKFPVKRWIFRPPFTMRLPKCLNKHPTASPTRSYQDLAPYLKDLQNFIYYLPRGSQKKATKISPNSHITPVFVSNSNSTSSSKGHICQALVFASAAATKQQQPATTERCQAASSTGFGRKRHDGAPQFTTASKRAVDGLWSISPAQKFGYRFYIKFIYIYIIYIYMVQACGPAPPPQWSWFP